MAITKTQTIEEISVLYNDMNNGKPALRVRKKQIIDDPEDNDLPVVTLKETYYRNEETDPETLETTATDLSAESSEVQAIAALVWAD